MMAGGMNPMMAGGMNPAMMNNFNPAMFANAAKLTNSLAEESMKISSKDDDGDDDNTQDEQEEQDKNDLAAKCAACDRFATEMLQISADAYPGGNNVDADRDLCVHVSPEFSSSCVSYVNQAGGLGDVDVLVSENRNAMCQHLEECSQLGAALSTGSEQDNDDEDNDDESAFLADDEQNEDDSEDEDDEESSRRHHRRHRKGNKLGTNDDSLSDLTKNMKQSSAIQMMNAKQMSDMELMNNALKLHDMQMEPALHELPCINKDDPECATAGLMHGMSYLMMANTMANGGLDNGGLSLAMLASAYPNNPHQNAKKRKKKKNKKIKKKRGKGKRKMNTSS